MTLFGVSVKLMRAIKFTKMVASGNDFVVLGGDFRGSRYNLTALARKFCDRKFGIGADGLLVVQPSGIATVRMRIFNPDGSEAEMCGNGARCVAFFTQKKNGSIETMAGIIDFEAGINTVKIRLTDPKEIQQDVPVRVFSRNIRVNFLNTGVPHAVIFVHGLGEMKIERLGGAIRYHKRFAPAGTNVDFVEVQGGNLINLRTYERGVEAETLACGTGTVASAVIFALKTGSGEKVKVKTMGGEVLTVYFKREGNAFSDVWLEGEVSPVFNGEVIIKERR